MGKYLVFYLKQFKTFKNCKHSISICILSLSRKENLVLQGFSHGFSQLELSTNVPFKRVIYFLISSSPKFLTPRYPGLGQLYHLCCLLIPLRHLICDSCSKPNRKGTCTFGWNTILQIRLSLIASYNWKQRQYNGRKWQIHGIISQKSQKQYQKNAEREKDKNSPWNSDTLCRQPRPSQALGLIIAFLNIW